MKKHTKLISSIACSFALMLLFCFNVEAQDYSYNCDDGVTVDVYGKGYDSGVATLTVPSPGNVFQTVVEVVYKGCDPGNSVNFTADGNTINAPEVVVSGGSSGVYVYRATIASSVTNLSTNAVCGNCASNSGLQSIVAYAFRNVANSGAIAGQFTQLSGYNDLQYFSIPISAGNGVRDIVVDVPISEVTSDGRYLSVTATAGGQTASQTINAPGAGNACCLNIITLTIPNVPSAATSVDFTVDSRHSSFPANGQSYVIAGLVNVAVECPDNPPLDNELFTCDDGVTVDIYGVGDECSNNRSVSIPNSGNVFAASVEVVYKGVDPGNYITVDVDGTSYNLSEVTLSGTSSSIHVYREVFYQNVNTVTLNNPPHACNAESLVVFAYRNVDSGSSFSTVYTQRSGYCDIQSINIPIPTDDVARDVKLVIPMSEITDDGRYLTIDATSNIGGATGSVTIFGPDNALGGCCLNIVELIVPNVPANATSIDFDIITDGANNPSGSTCGQSWVLAGTVYADTECVECTLAANAGNDETICEGESASLSANRTGGTSPFTYSWNNGLGNGRNKTASPATTTTYTVTVTDTNGCVDTDQVIVTVNPNPTANAGVNQAICSGGSATLTASGGGSYSWNNGLGNGATKTVSPTSTTTYTVTVTNANGCTDTDQVTITVNPNPTANAGADQAICSGGSATLTASGGGTYMWSNGLGAGATKTVSPTSTTTYTVTVTNANGCTDTDQVTITVSSASITDAGADQTICEGISATLTATGGDTYMWSNGLGAGATQTISPTTTTTYTVTVTSGAGCIDIDQVTVTVSAGPVIDAGFDVFRCDTETSFSDLTATGTAANVSVEYRGYRSLNFSSTSSDNDLYSNRYLKWLFSK